jgi:hypothetical protein
MLQRALDVVDSSETQFYPGATEQLGSLNDERGNAMLIRLAQSARIDPTRYLAAEALARAAVQGGFRDGSVTSALEQLASDSDEATCRSAALMMDQMR